MINSLLDSIKGWRSSSFKMQCFIVRSYSLVTTFNSEFSNKIYCYNRQFNLFQIDCWWCIGVSLRDVIIYTLNSLINAKFLQIIKKLFCVQLHWMNSDVWMLTEGEPAILQIMQVWCCSDHDISIKLNW